jgi:hypothetical protein
VEAALFEDSGLQGCDGAVERVVASIFKECSAIKRLETIHPSTQCHISKMAITIL